MTMTPLLLFALGSRNFAAHLRLRGGQQGYGQPPQQGYGAPQQPPPGYPGAPPPGYGPPGHAAGTGVVAQPRRSPAQ